MKKILLTTLNSKYIHSNLAIKYLKSNIKDYCSVKIEEYTINEDIDKILINIMKADYDLICFSCYIWNIEMTLKLCQNIKLVDKDVKILLGGPEVSYDRHSLMESNKYIDYILAMEGEINLKNFVLDNFDPTNIASMTYQKDGIIISNPISSPIEDLSKIKSAYEDINKEDIEEKIVYYETSRGCVYSCTYCLSSIEKGIRYFPIDKVKSELKKILEYSPKQVKFIDRTFNINPGRTLNLIDFLIGIDDGKVNFHFEITAHILNEKIMQKLKNVRKGLFQFEIGVQSTNKKTISEIERVDDFALISKKVSTIKEYGNIHQHLDLIAGLPYEDYDSFEKSFNDVINLRPDNLQLGFLKCLKGTKIRKNAQKYGITYRAYPPYEVISTDCISAKEIFNLKKIEKMLEIYYNSELFILSINHLMNLYSPHFMRVFNDMNTYKENMAYQDNLSLDNKFLFLYNFYKDKCKGKKNYSEDFMIECLRFDYHMVGKNRNIPDFLKNYPFDFNNKVKSSLFEKYNDKTKDSNIFKRYAVDIFAYDVKKGVEYNRIESEKNIVIFDYNYAKKVYYTVYELGVEDAKIIH